MRFVAIAAATLFAAIAATVALSSLIVLARQPSGPKARPCYLANNYILDVKSWTAEAMPNAKLKVEVTVGLNDFWGLDIFKTEKVAKLSGLVVLGTKGFSIEDPREPIGADDSYVYSRVLSGYDDDPLLTRPKGSIRAFACLISWTLTNGQEWNANH